MSDFLFRINDLGVVDFTYYINCDTKRKLPLTVYAFLDDQATEQVSNCLISTKKLTQFATRIFEKDFNIVIQPIGSQFLFYGNDLPNFKEVQDYFINLLSILAYHYVRPSGIDKEDYSFIYNSIQKLNNDLLNKTRETEKLNSQLNRVNSILNSRLVKDPLTGLISRYQYSDEIDLAIKKNPNAYGIFCFIDIDKFKDVNDEYGHSIGDLYLVEFAKRLKSLNYPNSIKMRIAGDEFGLYIPNIHDVDELTIKQVAINIHDSLCFPIEISNLKLNLNFSLGISIYNKDTSDVHLLIDYADFAMYRTKKNPETFYEIFCLEEYLNFMKNQRRE